MFRGAWAELLTQRDGSWPNPLAVTEQTCAVEYSEPRELVKIYLFASLTCEFSSEAGNELQQNEAL